MIERKFMSPEGFENDTTFDAWERIGHVAHGETWRARRVHDDHPVIVKISDPAPDDSFQQLHAIFEKKGLNNRPELQRFLLVMRAGPNVALIFDFVDGETLRERLGGGETLPVDTLRQIGADILRGLTALHRAGLIHRDVTPENIVLGTEGAVLIDYGAVGQLTRRARFAQTTIGGDFAGKFLYAAPEQLSGAPQSSAVDIWALGAVLYEACTGQDFRSGTTPREILESALEAPDLDAVPEALRPALSAMLALDPARRPDAATAQTLLSGTAEMHDIPEDWDALLKKDFGVKRAPSIDGDAILSPMKDPFADPAPAPQSAPDNWDQDDPVAAPALPPAASSPAPYPPAAPRTSLGPAHPTPKATPGPGLWLLLLPVLALAGAGVYLFLSGTLHTPGALPLLPLAFICLGLVLALLGLVFWKRGGPEPATGENPFWASALMDTPDARDVLTRTILVNIEALYSRSQAPGGGLLAVQMAALAKEYSDAETSEQRIEALRMLNDLHMRAAETPSTFWRGWDSAAGRIASLASLLAGLVALAEGVRRLF